MISERPGGFGLGILCSAFGSTKSNSLKFGRCYSVQRLWLHSQPGAVVIWGSGLELKRFAGTRTGTQCCSLARLAMSMYLVWLPRCGLSCCGL